jgi:uncharacterized protein YqeY
MSAVYKVLKDDIIDCMKSGNKVKLVWLRSLDAAIQTEVLDTREERTDNLVHRVVKRELKKVGEEIDCAKRAGLGGLVCQKIDEQVAVLKYAPNELTEDQIREAVNGCIDLVNATSIKDIGKVMAKIKELYQSTIDMKIASSLVKTKLSNISP